MLAVWGCRLENGPRIGSYSDPMFDCAGHFTILPKPRNRIRGTEYPQAEDFAVQSVLTPPSEEKMLEAFTSVELTP